MPLPKKPFIIASDRDAFECQPKEPDKAWKAFIFYRDAGLDRSQKKVALSIQEATGTDAKLSSVERQVAYWASRWGWVIRVRAWDMEVDKRRRGDLLKAVQKSRSQHVQLARSLQHLGATELAKWLKLAKARADLRYLTVKEVLYAIESGIKLERASLGEPEAIVEHQHQVTVDDKREAMRKLLSDEESLQAIDLILQKANDDPSEKPSA